jgi:hypothetical protein
MSATNDSRLAKTASVDQKQLDQAPSSSEVTDEVTNTVLIPVRQDSADQVNFYTRVVASGTNPVVLLFPRDPDRYRVTVMTADEPVVLAQTREMAGAAANTVSSTPNPVGFYLPVNIAVPIYAKGPCYVGATSGTATRVSVIVEKYEPHS